MQCSHPHLYLPSLPLGGRTADEIVTWVVKNSGPPAIELTDAEKAKKFIDKDTVVVIGFFESNTSDKAVAYLAAADVIDSVAFAIVKSSDVAKSVGAEMETIVVYRPVSSLLVYVYMHIY